MGGLVSSQKFGTGTRYGLEILHQCGKRVKNTSQKCSGANSYVCRSYRGKTGRGESATLLCMDYTPEFYLMKAHG